MSTEVAVVVLPIFIDLFSPDPRIVLPHVAAVLVNHGKRLI